MADLCLLSPKFDQHIGGMETHGYEFARYFMDHGRHPLRAVLTKQNVTDGVPVCADDSQVHQPSSNGWTTGVVKPLLTGDFDADAQAIIETTDVPRTILYLNSPTWLPACALVKSAYPETKVIVRSGGNDIVAGWIGDETNTKDIIEESRRRLVTLVNSTADYFIANSRFSYERSVRSGVDPHKAVVISGGVACDRFKPNGHSPHFPLTIITAARLVKFKGIEYSLEAFRRAQESVRTPLQYRIIGDGPRRTELEELARGLQDVDFVGAVSVARMHEEYRQGDILLHMPILEKRIERGSSYLHTETMGRSLCEAASAGLPAVVTGVGGVPEIVQDGITGFVVGEGAVGEATERLVRLINDPELRRRMGENARANALRRFDWRTIFRQYDAMFA